MTTVYTMRKRTGNKETDVYILGPTQNTTANTQNLQTLDEMDFEEPSYGIESLGLVGLRTEIRNEKIKKIFSFLVFKGLNIPEHWFF